MVTTTEMQGLQGWFLQRLGCFGIDQENPGTSSLRYALDLLAHGEQLVVFPEGKISRNQEDLELEAGLPRLASLARTKGLEVPIIPVGLAYSHPVPRWRDRAALCFGAPLRLEGTGRAAAAELAKRLAQQMRSAEEAARTWVGVSSITK
jgi:1-acyl-sn-glycerol-3-phosphate acyltransferase